MSNPYDIDDKIGAIVAIEERKLSVDKPLQHDMQPSQHDKSYSVRVDRSVKKNIHMGKSITDDYTEIPKNEWGNIDLTNKNKVRYINSKNEVKGDFFLNDVEIQENNYLFKFRIGNKSFSMHGSNIKHLYRHNGKKIDMLNQYANPHVNPPSNPHVNQYANPPSNPPSNPHVNPHVNPSIQDRQLKLGEDLLFGGPESFKLEVNERIKELETKVEKQNKDIIEMFKMLKKIYNTVNN